MTIENLEFFLLKKKSLIYNFNVDILKPVKSKQTSEIFSSSLIRKYIQEGNFKNDPAFIDTLFADPGFLMKKNTDLLVSIPPRYADKQEEADRWFALGDARARRAARIGRYAIRCTRRVLGVCTDWVL